MQPPKPYRAKLIEKYQLNEKFIHGIFECVEPANVDFSAGQYVSVVMPDGQTRRSYSLCQSPSMNHGFELLVDTGPGGPGSQYFHQLKIGDEISCLLPLGRFTMDSIMQLTTPIVFVATGSGIAPFRSMIGALLEAGQQRQIFLHWGLRHVKDLFWEDEFQRLAEKFPNFKFHPTISQPEVEWPLCAGRVTDCLSTHELLPEADYFLCGNSPMLIDVTELLLAKGIPKEKIHTEKFH